MAAYLVENPPARSQFRRPRRLAPSGVVVVHTAESPPDTSGPDSGAENVARWIRGRPDPGSYHDLADSDSCIQLVPYDAEAFHDGTGSNPHSYGVSAATRAALWPALPQGWVDGCVLQMAAASARYAVWLRARRGIVIPARRISRSESELRMPGFISHGERDPARRTDPGAGFPWPAFLAEFSRLTNPTPPTPKPPEEDDMPAARKITVAGTNPQRYAYVLPDGLVVDGDHKGQPLVAGAGSVGAFDAVYGAGVANALQVDIVQAAVRRARG